MKVVDYNRKRVTVAAVASLLVLAVFLFVWLRNVDKSTGVGDVSPRRDVPTSSSAGNSDEFLNNGRSGEGLPQARSELAAKNERQRAAFASRAALECYTAVTDVVRMKNLIAGREERHLAKRAPASDENLDARLLLAQRRERDCSGANFDQLLAKARDTTLRAAELGDPDAQMCAVEQRFFSFSSNEPSQSSFQQNQELAAEFLESGLQRGDWRSVELMQLKSRSIGRRPIGAKLDNTPSDRVSYYRAKLLLRMGAVDTYKAELDEEIDDFRSHINPALISAGNGLSDIDLANSEVWASEEFSSFFSRAPKLSAAPIPCGFY